jgi:TRAP-type C4-dicarboxylate transport system permease small subunit
MGTSVINLLRRAANAIMAALRVAAGTMLIASVVINFANIVGRYVFSVSISWAEEAMLFLMIGCVFLGAAPVGWLGRHIRMDVVVSMLPAGARAMLELFADLVTMATCVMLAIFAWPMITMFAQLDQRSETANIPLVIPEAVVPLGLMLMALLIAVRLIVLGTRHGDTISARDIEH